MKGELGKYIDYLIAVCIGALGWLSLFALVGGMYELLGINQRYKAATVIATAIASSAVYGAVFLMVFFWLRRRRNRKDRE